MSLHLIDFLKHIHHEAEYIVKVSSEKTKEEVINDETLFKAIVRSLEIIGEATKRLPYDFTIKYPQISWSDMAKMRDVLIHNYFGVDYDIVWNTVINDIPELEYELKLIIILEGNF